MARGTQYALTLINKSSQPWAFYLYQKLPGQTIDVFSLAWLCSSHEIKVGQQVRFQWDISYHFSWARTGQLMPGLLYQTSGSKKCDPNGANSTDFDVTSSPGLSTPVQGAPAGSLSVRDGVSVQPNMFSVGIGMSGSETFAVQAGRGLTHNFSAAPSYWIAAGTNIQRGTTLNNITGGMDREAKFPPGTYDLTGTLDQNYTWTIT